MQAEFEISLGLSESDSSDESEEDPDGDEPAARPESSSSSVTINNEEPIAIDDADVFDPEVVEQAVQAAPTVEARPAAPQRKRFTAPKPVSANPNECVRVYFVKQQKIIDGAWEDEPFLLAPYVDRQDANERLHREAEKCRAERPAKYIESIDTDSLCSAQIFYDEEEQNGIWFAVMSDPIAKSQLKNVDTTLLGKRYPERIWTVRRKITNRTVDEETNMTTINTETTRLEPSFSDLKLANNDAAKKMLDFLRPTVPRMDWVEKHENMCGAQIRESRDERNKAKLLFGAEVDKEELPWLNCESVEFEVLEGKIEGPLN
ncbi:hypothetical protein B0J14DRAFT_599664 [Halenospora varia]|nr:hypothetical protein B0J14DRAFT_599664 [Halenospora varia]